MRQQLTWRSRMLLTFITSPQTPASGSPCTPLGSISPRMCRARRSSGKAIQKRPGQIKRFILASSRAIYGEGRYSCARCGEVVPDQRSEEQLLRADWRHHCPVCSADLEPRPSDENTQPSPVSVYGLTKKIQEDICRLMGNTLGVPIAILRYFNVYGPRQSVTNPYTGVIPMFCTRIRSGRPIQLYEQGVPLRDFVHVNDVVDANIAALSLTGDVHVVNVGSGTALSLREVADIAVLGPRCRSERSAHDEVSSWRHPRLLCEP